MLDQIAIYLPVIFLIGILAVANIWYWWGGGRQRLKPEPDDSNPDPNQW